MRVPTAKRGLEERTGLLAWFPYYAGFSAEFVRTSIRELAPKQPCIVADPMNGSGTTTAVAQSLGHYAVGADLNPFMAILAGAKDSNLANLLRTNRISLPLCPSDSTKAQSETQFRNDISAANEQRWLPPEIFRTIRCFIDAVETAAPDPSESLATALKDINAIPGKSYCGTAAFQIGAALTIARSFTNLSRLSNPTWLKPGDNSSSRPQLTFNDFLVRQLGQMTEDLKRFFGEGKKERMVASLNCDFRAIPLNAGSVDLIVTSPPYLTRLDYSVSTAPELALLGVDGHSISSSLRRSQMGSLITSGATPSTEIEVEIGVARLLSQIASHRSKASANYYRKFFSNYFISAFALISKLSHLLKPGGKAILVVQDSWYKDIHIDLGQLYANFARKAHLKAKIIRTETVKRILTTINRSALAYNKGGIQEHVLVLEKKKSNGSHK